MKKTTLQIFEELPSNEYFKNYKQALPFFKTINYFPPETLGFDASSGGFIALHRLHQDYALRQELPACLLLKSLGYPVLLTEESGYFQSPDAVVSEIKFEIKRISAAKNIQRAVLNQFRTAYRKADNLILHIDQLASSESLRGAIYSATAQYHVFRQVWVIYRGVLYPLRRKQILKGEYKFQ